MSDPLPVDLGPRPESTITRYRRTLACGAPRCICYFYFTAAYTVRDPARSVAFHESVREADVYIVATASSPDTATNGALME